MTYAQYGTIQATDYNNLVGSNPSTTANVMNTTWSTGGGTNGYGQTALAQVSAGGTVTAAQWANLVVAQANSASHQGTTISSITAPVAGGTITYLSALPTNIASVYTNKLNAATQGATTSNAVTTGTTWSDKATWTHTVTFANGDAARYFFNSGGQIKVTQSHPSGTGINALFNALATACGTVVMSAMSSGTANIASTTYNGITKVGGSGSATLSTNSGYYAQTTANVQVFNQVAASGPAGYLSTNSTILTKSNGTQGSNADAGSVITIYTVWDEIPNGLVVASGSSVTVSAVAPETTNLANSWGTITVAGSVAVV
jgi:hypothetical protein